MNGCLSERAFLRLYVREGTAAEQSHVRLCADCAERYDLMMEDLATIGRVLEAPPLASQSPLVVPWRLRWLPVATACAALLILALGGAWLQRPLPVQVAVRTSSDSGFAADLSAALFATTDTNAFPQLAFEAPYIEAALDAGQPCTPDRFFTGECNDQVSAFLIEGE